ADLYALKKSQKTLEARMQAECTEVIPNQTCSVEAILGEADPTTGAVAGAASPIPKLSAYDVLLEISNHVPPRDKITLDVDKVEIDEQHVSVEGLAKAPDSKDPTAAAGAVDSAFNELKKFECLKDAQPGDST